MYTIQAGALVLLVVPILPLNHLVLAYHVVLVLVPGSYKSAIYVRSWRQWGLWRALLGLLLCQLGLLVCALFMALSSGLVLSARALLLHPLRHGFDADHRQPE